MVQQSWRPQLGVDGVIQNDRGDGNLAVDARLDRISDSLFNSGMALQRILNGRRENVETVQNHDVVGASMKDERLARP